MTIARELNRHRQVVPSDITIVEEKKTIGKWGPKEFQDGSEHHALHKKKTQ